MKFEYWLSNIYIDNTKKINLKRSGIDAKTLFYMKNDELEKLQILTGKDIEKKGGTAKLAVPKRVYIVFCIGNIRLHVISFSETIVIFG